MGRVARFAIVFSAVLLAGSSPAGDPFAGDAAEAARRFLASVSPELRARARLAFGASERTRWSYLPGKREGVALGDLAPAPRDAAWALVRSGFSARGVEKARGVVVLEGILRETEVFGALSRDPGRYWLAIFGEPSPDAPWGWRLEGHHLSLHYTSVTNRVSSAAPAFFGANPARVAEGPRKGLRVLGAEEDLARALVTSLDPARRARAVLSDDAPGDILFGPSRRSPPAAEGLSYGEMTPAQQETLLRLIGEYLGNLRPDLAEAQWTRIRASGLDAVRFAWAGPLERGRGHYYRVQGPTFVVEYDNTQNGANHVHSVFRDLTGDFGEDLLRKHYRESHGGR